jgi:predicted transcriptional regulator of viral defense system
MVEPQQGLFTTEQAAQARFSSQLLHKHAHGGNLEHAHRGIYRLKRFPASRRDQEDLIIAWLWSGQAGVMSHETALQLHGLSDALPAFIQLTVPAAWSGRRVRPPDGVRLHFADVAEPERTWVGAVPTTSAARSIVDVALANGDPDVVDRAARQAIRQNLVDLADLAPAVVWLAKLKSER